MSDGQFASLKSFRGKLPAGATVSLYRAWDDEDPSDSDVETTNHVLYAMATWTQGEIKIIARQDLTQ